MAKRFSEDPGSKEQGGDLGWQRASTWVPEFAAALQRLRIGEVSPVVETAYGFHIIKLEKVRGAERQARHILIRPVTSAEGAAEVGRGVMTANDLARPHRGRHLGVHLVVAPVDAGEVHHLPQANDARPGHSLGHLVGADGRAGRLQPGRAGHATGHLHVDVDRQCGCLVVHEGWQLSGVGAEIVALVAGEAMDHLDAPPERVTNLDVPMPYARNLEDLVLPSPERVVAAIRRVLGRNESRAAPAATARAR